MEGICDQSERVMLAMLWIFLTYPFAFFRPRQFSLDAAFAREVWAAPLVSDVLRGASGWKFALKLLEMRG
jgi:hypothetical protein